MNQQFSKTQIWQIIASTSIALGFFEVLKFAYQAYLTVQSQLEQYDQLKEQLGKEATKPDVADILQQSKLYYLLASALVAILVGLLIFVIIKRNNDKVVEVEKPVKKTTASAVEKRPATKTTTTKKPAAKKATTKKSTAKKTTKK